MSLACLACHAVDSSPGRVPEILRNYSVSSRSNGGGRCGVTINCWSRKSSPSTSPLPAENPDSPGHRQQDVSTPTTNPSLSSPRLTRCHAVRRDIFRDWNFDEIDERREVSRQDVSTDVSSQA